MRRILVGLQTLSDEKKQGILLVATGLTAVYALITIIAMVKLNALTMILFMGAQAVLGLAVLLYLVLVLSTRESITRRHVAPGEVIFRQGDSGREVYVVISGEAEVVQEQPGTGETVIARIGSGGFFGETALIQNAPRVSTVRALTDLDVLVMQRGPFLSLFTHLPVLRQTFQQVLEQRADELRALARQ